MTAPTDGTRAQRRIMTVNGEDIEFVLIPAGPFLMGTREEDVGRVVAAYPRVREDWIFKEVPQHQVNLPAYYISRTPVTNRVWESYIMSTGSQAPFGWDTDDPRSKPNHPVWGTQFDGVLAFCAWLQQMSGYNIRPPSEPEWEKAARGTDGREYPWGNEFAISKCNTREGDYGGTTPVDRFAAGASVYGVLDMAGNIEEWTADLYTPYPGGRSIQDDFGGPGGYRVIRGGSWTSAFELARCARRHGGRPDSVIGVRLVLDP